MLSPFKLTMFQQTETVSTGLKEKGFNVHGYHAGMSSDVRTSVQDKFMVGKNIIVCFMRHQAPLAL